MSVVQSDRLITIEEFSRMPADGKCRELVRGRVIEMNPPKLRHGQVCSKIGRIYGNAADDSELGHVVTNDTGIITQRDPDTLRGADVAFYSYSKIPRGPLPEDYPSAPPEVVFEVLSPSDQWSKVHGKVSEYLEVGVSVVCVVEPKTETVHVYRPDQAAKELKGNDELVLPEFSAEFRISIKQFFD